MGYKPVNDQAADQLMNPNINPQNGSQIPIAEEKVEDNSGGGISLSKMKVSEIM